MDFKDENELLAYAKEIEGLRISDLGAKVGRMDLIHRKHTKGLVAQLIEQTYFGIPTNSSEKPDFQDLGIELKVSPLKLVKSTGWYNAKERNVIKMVDYFNIHENKNWKDSKLIHKLNRVLFVLYVHDKEKPATEWQIVSTFLWSPSEKEDALIQKDYDIIRDKIKSGEVNSERDNDFLGTCPKHQGGYNKQNPSESKQSALRDHPVMGRAEKRGFCIKQRSFDQLIADSLGQELLRKGNSVGLPASAYPMLGKEVEYVPFFSRETAKELKKKDIYGERYAQNPNKVASDLGITGDQKKRFMQVLTGRMKFQDLKSDEYATYDVFRNRVRAGGARLEQGEGSFY